MAGIVQENYFTIDRESAEEFKDRGSRFIAYAFPVADTSVFKKRLQELKKEHIKAVHHCFAWRLGLTGDNFRSSDDGEPAGTAGKPILGQIDSRKLTDTAIIVVRYFGGTLLGVPGLINAYKTASALALQTIPIIQKQVEVKFTLHFDYTRLNDVMHILKQANGTILKQEMQLFCDVTAGIPVSRIEQVKLQLAEIQVDFSTFAS